MFGGFAPLPLRLGGDAQRGFTAAQLARLAEDLAGLVRVAPLAVLSFDKAGAVVTVLAYTAQHGSGITAAPTALALGPGLLTWSWSQEYEDAYGVSWPWRIRHATVTPSASGVLPLAAHVSLANAWSLTVHTVDVSTNNALDAGATLVVW